MLQLTPADCLKLAGPTRKNALLSVSKVSLLFTVLVVTPASFATSERLFLGSSRIAYTILQSVLDILMLQGVRLLLHIVSFSAPQMVRMSCTFLDRA